PNPTSGLCTIVFLINKYEDVDISIYDLMGRILKTLKKKYYPKGDNYEQIDLTNFSPGTYWLTLKTSEEKLFTKIELVK
ncbi:MAG TPA: T9SS type A sorting domain-containing protein, partial [Bacteroidales bacterium]|nr:T9SS type A sorting domain-containing protein [Bacteroidales bacterium]